MRSRAKIRTGWFSRSRCLHAAVIARGEHTGKCLDCRAEVTTPFTIHSRGQGAGRTEFSSAVGSCAMGQLIDMADYRLPPAVGALASFDSSLDGAA